MISFLIIITNDRCFLKIALKIQLITSKYFRIVTHKKRTPVKTESVIAIHQKVFLTPLFS